MRRFTLVTTCHAAGFEAYGRRMLETCDRHWTSEVRLRDKQAVLLKLDPAITPALAK